MKKQHNEYPVQERRRALAQIIGIASVAAGTAAIPTSAFANTNCAAEIGVGNMGGADLTRLPYVKLDPKKVAKRAYEGYGRGGCMYGVFDALFAELTEQLKAQNHPDAARVEALPTNLSLYGAGGIAGWGTLCGCLNATAMGINILDIKDPDGNSMQSKIISSVFHYYETANMPAGNASLSNDGTKFVDMIGAPTRNDDAGQPLTPEKISQSVAGTVLCHASVTKWSKVSKYGSKHAAKAERCGQLTAEVAYTLVEFANMAIEGKFTASLKSEDNAECMACHSGSKAEPVTYKVSDVNSNMECQSCHAPHDVSANISNAHDGATCSTCH
ncbi:C-GCAxxG-C-C family (seleno)protein [Paraferrimonas sedimenticola]|uniref:Tat pathway signal protein n=1 Tax=Paraferrimonas sedimenticola TaxID=375674 RepID=A0AA37RYG7_9GAMM|nr:C-GCAxxG-C-C family (seleno)protein [Paraferrimonas sedimenticola]GLP97052.1 Tat pathway signal protein [Paraferrimonas sedimenticola]